jgi:alpha-beta hydrolase superfamily lysophospholipase
MKRLSIPLLFIVGSADPVVSKLTLSNLLKSTATSFFDKKLVIFEGLLHRPFDDIGRDQIMSIIMKWVLERIPKT